MASSISLGSTVIPVGNRQFIVDNLPGNSEGFELALGCSPWDALVGRLFNLQLEISLDGINWQSWISFGVDGGQKLDSQGVPLTVWGLVGTWPGQTDQNGNRQKLRAVSLRVNLEVVQTFTCSSVSLRTV